MIRCRPATHDKGDGPIQNEYIYTGWNCMPSRELIHEWL